MVDAIHYIILCFNTNTNGRGRGNPYPQALKTIVGQGVKKDERRRAGERAGVKERGNSEAKRDTERERESDTQTHRHRHIDIDTSTYRHISISTYRHIDTQTHRHIYRHTNIHTETDKETGLDVGKGDEFEAYAGEVTAVAGMKNDLEAVVLFELCVGCTP